LQPKTAGERVLTAFRLGRIADRPQRRCAAEA
jgi:hypothetical protein